jgi:hypothetical protein
LQTIASKIKLMDLARNRGGRSFDGKYAALCSAVLYEAQLHKAGRKVRRSWLVEVGQIDAAA